MNPSFGARLAGRPLALTPRALDGLMTATSPPDHASPGGLALEGMAPPEPAENYQVIDGGIAVVPIHGPLLSQPDPWASLLFAATDYATLGRTFEAAFADPETHAVLLEVDSPGGEVAGLFDLVDHLAALRQASGKPLWAVSTYCACSAAYALAVPADRLLVSGTGEVGSIGIVAMHVDQSAADARHGLHWSLIHAGARKIDRTPHRPLSEPAAAALQADVDALYETVVESVARHRSLTPDTVRATEGAIYRGRRGVTAGLADGIGTTRQALADLGARARATSVAVSSSLRPASTASTERSPSMTDPTTTRLPRLRESALTV